MEKIWILCEMDFFGSQVDPFNGLPIHGVYRTKEEALDAQNDLLKNYDDMEEVDGHWESESEDTKIWIEEYKIN